MQNSGIPQDFESAGSGILQKLQLSFLEILKFLGTQFGVVHGGGVDIFWNSPLCLEFLAFWEMTQLPMCVAVCGAGTGLAVNTEGKLGFLPGISRLGE